MYSKVNYTVVGVFVLLFGIGVVWFAFWLGKYGMEDEYYTYKLEMSDSVSGLSEDADVMLRGVDIGRVTKIQINPKNIEKTEIYIQIKQSVPIKEDMVASTKMFGVTGLLSAKTLQPTDDYIPIIKTKESFVTTLSANVGSLSEKLNTLLSQSEKLLSNENINKIDRILDNIERASNKGESSLDELSSSLHEFRNAMRKLNRKFDNVGNDVEEIKKVLIPTINNFNRVTLDVEQSLDRGDYNLKKILEPVLVDMQILSSQLNDMAIQMEQSPSDLLFKSRKPLKGPGE